MVIGSDTLLIYRCVTVCVWGGEPEEGERTENDVSKVWYMLCVSPLMMLLDPTERTPDSALSRSSDSFPELKLSRCRSRCWVIMLNNIMKGGAGARKRGRKCWWVKKRKKKNNTNAIPKVTPNRWGQQMPAGVWSWKSRTDPKGKETGMGGWTDGNSRLF